MKQQNGGGGGGWWESPSAEGCKWCLPAEFLWDPYDHGISTLLDHCEGVCGPVCLPLFASWAFWDLLPLSPALDYILLLQCIDYEWVWSLKLVEVEFSAWPFVKIAKGAF